MKLHWQVGSSFDTYEYRVDLDCGDSATLSSEPIPNYKWAEIWDNFQCHVCGKKSKIKQMTLHHNVIINSQGIMDK